METAFDWITVIIFAGLVTHFLSDSTRPEPSNISLWHYLLASVGCAGANWLGNEGHVLAATLLLLAILVYLYRVFGPRSASH
jgi:hypothetical protein